MMTSPDPPLLRPFMNALEKRSTLSSEDEDAFLALPYTVLEIRANRDFVRQGECLHHCCFVVEGIIGSFKQDAQGNRQIVSVFIDGDMVDLHSAVVPESLSALQALTTSKIVQVPHSAIRKIAADHPNMGQAFWRQCVVDAGILMEWVANVGRRDARTRMAHFFCELACRSEPDGAKDGTVIPYPLTQTHLSDILSLTPVHVNRTLQSLRREGLIETLGRSRERVVDWSGLRRLGDFDPLYLQLKRQPRAPALA